MLLLSLVTSASVETSTIKYDDGFVAVSGDLQVDGDVLYVGDDIEIDLLTGSVTQAGREDIIAKMVGQQLTEDVWVTFDFASQTCSFEWDQPEGTYVVAFGDNTLDVGLDYAKSAHADAEVGFGSLDYVVSGTGASWELTSRDGDTMTVATDSKEPFHHADAVAFCYQKIIWTYQTDDDGTPLASIDSGFKKVQLKGVASHDVFIPGRVYTLRLVDSSVDVTVTGSVANVKESTSATKH